MRTATLPVLLATILCLAASGCGPGTPARATPLPPEPTRPPATRTPLPPRATPVPPGEDPAPVTPAASATAPSPGGLAPVTIQEGNQLPRRGLEPKRSAELEDNRIGVLVGGLTGGGWKPGDPWDSTWMVERVTSLGLKRFRVSIDNLDAGSPDLDWSIPEFSIDPSHDALFTRLAENGVAITYVLTFWDKEAWPGGVGANCPRFKEEAEIQRYLDFARFIVGRFKDRVQTFEIWNEPNRQACPQWIEVADYVNLVRRAAPVIRQENPQARIVVGATSYLGEPESREYLFGVLASDAMPLVDVVSWHPMYGASPEFDSAYYERYPAVVRAIKDLAAANGFEGEYEADELTWFTSDGLFWDGWSRRYSDVVAAKYQARAILTHLGMDVTVGVGSALMFDTSWVSIPATIRNLCTLLAGAEAAELPIEIETGAREVVSYDFALPGGEYLVAVWLDRAAVEGDPGESADLAFPGFSAGRVTAIDVLNGFEQELLASEEEGRLVVRRLLIRDYPLLLRLAGVAAP